MRLATLLDPAALCERCPAGFGGETGRWVAVGRHLVAQGYPPTTRLRALFVPGRIELVGKHTDYAGGRSLTAATAQGLYLALVARSDHVLRLLDLARGEDVVLDLGDRLSVAPGHWTAYPAAVVRRLRRDFALESQGADVVFASTLPAAAGMSSSSALVVAAGLAMAGIAWPEAVPIQGVEREGREWLAGYLASVEAGQAMSGPIRAPFLATARRGETSAEQEDPGVGTRGGSEDHTAILCSRAGRLARYSYLPTRLERWVELPAGLTFAVAVSGVRAKKAGDARAAYNRASALAAELAEHWRLETGRAAPHLAAILALGASAREELARLAAATGHHARRLAHFVAESEEIVPAMTDALAAGDLAACGRLADHSQRLAERLLGNQVAETVHLATSARERGAHAASAFGAGFGGAVWALIDEKRAAAFLDGWRAAYLETFPQRVATADFLVTGAGPAAFELSDG